MAAAATKTTTSTLNQLTYNKIYCKFSKFFTYIYIIRINLIYNLKERKVYI